MNGNVIRTITIQGKAEGIDKITGDLNKLAAAQENVAIVSEKTGKSLLSLEDAWKKQTLKLDEAARAQANIARETKLADAALREGVATQAQHAQRLEQINQRYNTASQATQKFGQQTGLARHELINLGRQFQDVGVQVASGAGLFTIAAQQLPQIADVFISSRASVGSFFSQALGWAKSFAMSTAGVVTGIVAIGGAAIYAAYQFTRASTTIEEALKEQNRLYKEGKALIDARTSVEEKSQLQSKEQTQFETMRNRIDLQLKLNAAMEDAAQLAASRAGTPTGGGMPEMGIAPSGIAPLKDPGMDKIIAAYDRLKAAQDAGLPGLKDFNAELAKVGMAHPELARTVEKMIEAGQAGMQLELAALRAKAMADALAGIATNAQLAAVGLGSIAQFNLNNLQADQAREATERHAVAVMQLVKNYGDLGPVAARQVHALEQQLQLTQARTGAEQMSIQFNQTLANADLQRLTAAEALRVATLQRAIAEAEVNKQADQTLKNLQEQGEVLRAGSDFERERIKAAQTYNKLIKEGVDSLKAGAVASQMLANARYEESLREAAEASEEIARSAERAANFRRRDAQAAEDLANEMARIQASNAAIIAQTKFVPFATDWTSGAPKTLSANVYQTPNGFSQFNPQGYTSGTTGSSNLLMGLTAKYGVGGFDPTTGLPNAQGTEKTFNEELVKAGGDFAVLAKNILTSPGGLTSQGVTGGVGGIDMNKVSLLNRALELLPKEQQILGYTMELQQLQQQPASLANSELIKSLTEKLQGLTQATDQNTSATQTQTDVLSPFYSSDPRRTHLGFRAFAGGGIMTQYGELPLKQYQGGGIATSPQVAVFGEGSTPEAYVPAPGGRIPVKIEAANSNQRPINVTINVMGNADAGTVSALKTTAFQQSRALRRVAG